MFAESVSTKTATLIWALTFAAYREEVIEFESKVGYIYVSSRRIRSVQRMRMVAKRVLKIDPVILVFCQYFHADIKGAFLGGMGHR